MTSPVPWALAWQEDGELASQDRFDLLQTLVACESSDVQSSLIAAVEKLAVAELSVLSSSQSTRLCA